MHDKVYKVVFERLSSSRASRSRVSRAMMMSPSIGPGCDPALTGNAGNDSTLVGLSLPRHSAFRVWIDASSVKTTLSSLAALFSPRLDQAASTDFLTSPSRAFSSCQLPASIMISIWIALFDTFCGGSPCWLAASSFQLLERRASNQTHRSLCLSIIFPIKAGSEISRWTDFPAQAVRLFGIMLWKAACQETDSLC